GFFSLNIKKMNTIFCGFICNNLFTKVNQFVPKEIDKDLVSRTQRAKLYSCPFEVATSRFTSSA
ncbi:MAG: hypothetical protein AAF573_01705, partial [Bacteroidota bacterium]